MSMQKQVGSIIAGNISPWYKEMTIPATPYCREFAMDPKCLATSGLEASFM